MPFVLLIIGVILVIAAVRNSHGSLFTALEQDVPAYSKWAAAIFGIGALGWVPGLKEPSRWLLALVVVVLVLSNYKNILASFTGLASAPAPAPAPATPAATYASSTGQPAPVTPAATTMTASGSGSNTGSNIQHIAASAATSAAGTILAHALTLI